MITLHDNGVFLTGGIPQADAGISPEEGRKRTMAWSSRIVAMSFCEPRSCS